MAGADDHTKAGLGAAAVTHADVQPGAPDDNQPNQLSPQLENWRQFAATLRQEGTNTPTEGR